MDPISITDFTISTADTEPLDCLMDTNCFQCYGCILLWNTQHTHEYREIHNMFNMLTKVVVPRLDVDEVDFDYMNVDRAMILHPTNRQATSIQRIVRGWLTRMENVRMFEEWMCKLNLLEQTTLLHQPQLKHFGKQFLARSRVHRTKVRYLYYPSLGEYDSMDY